MLMLPVDIKFIYKNLENEVVMLKIIERVHQVRGESGKMKVRKSGHHDGVFQSFEMIHMIALKLTCIFYVF